MAKIKETGKGKGSEKSGGSAKSSSSGAGGSGKSGGGSAGGSGKGGGSGGGAAASASGDPNIRLGVDADKLMRTAGAIGAGFLGASLALGLAKSDNLEQFLHSYLVAFMWILAICLGGLWWVTLQHLVNAHWSVVVRRVGELIAAAMPVVAILSLPIIVSAMTGNASLFPWVDQQAVHADHILEHKSKYLNTTFFFIRCLIYFGFWSLLARYWFKTSVEQDSSGKTDLAGRLQGVSAPSMIAIALTLTFCAIDFMMSLDKLFFSTIWGVYYFACMVLCFHATLALSLMWLQKKQRLVGMVTIEHYHDVGKMMFAFTIFWSYIAFSQFMLIWYANIPEETAWFKPRFTNDWKLVSAALLFGKFAIPFLGLMSRQVKRNPKLLGFWAVWVLAINYVDMYWLIMPQLDPQNPPLSLLDLTCLIGVAGVFVAAVAFNAKNVNLVPTKDPRLPKSLAFENI
jgi:hypothetical protein